MELQNNSEHLSVQPVIVDPEQLALQALVDEMLARQDAQAFAIMNKIVQRVRGEPDEC